MSLEVRFTHTPKIGFASHQNAVALLKEFSIENTTSDTIENLSVKLTSSPHFLEPKIWKLDRLDPNTPLNIRDRDIKLDAAKLVELTESISGDLVLEVTTQATQDNAKDIEIFRATYPVELLAKAHWGGVGSMPELLPAFCMPNDPAVDKVLKHACKVLKRAGKSSAINGYENASRTRTWELASAIWSAVVGLQINYALPPASFEQNGQKIRTPGAILDGGLATCLDLSMLFASALEQASLNPLLILTEGHAFVGVWLQPLEFNQMTTEDALTVRKRSELQDLIVFETTLATNSPAPPFSTAVEIGTKKLTDDDFVMAVDIRRARMRKIKPLGFSSVTKETNEDAAIPLPEDALEEAPALPGFDIDLSNVSVTGDDRVEQWQRKLLDLTARNRLLNLPIKSKHVPLLCPAPGDLEDLLAAGKSIRVSPIPDFESGGRDTNLYQQQTKEDLREEYAIDALKGNEVLSPLPPKKLEAELIDLYRRARTDMDEGGANTLFLALGFLNWKKAPEDPRSYRAPLIMVPVKLVRKSALSGVKMSAHEDETRFNLTLLELLRQDFDLNIPGLDGALPEDESGIDVTTIWNLVRVAVKEIPGFEVTTESAIGTFSFAKYLMWKDLADRREQLINNPVVKQLIERGDHGFESEGRFPQAEELDTELSPSEIFAPLPADSSQLTAVIASSCKCNFVLDGPPGTGKSQTIANMIVHNLSIGKRVLFVAEKMAALDVVQRRLKERGLADFCLEVHSNKTSKLEVIQQLDKAWSARGELTQEEWDRETSRLRALRDKLNNVCERLHRRRSNGLSIYLAVGQVVKNHDSSIPKLQWPAGTEHTEDEFQSMLQSVEKMSLNYNGLDESPSEFSVIKSTAWSNSWQDLLLGTANNLPKHLDELKHSATELIKISKLPITTVSLKDFERLELLGRTLLSTYQKDVAFVFSPQLRERLEDARQFIELLGLYQETEPRLSIRYPLESIRTINVDQLEAQWADANTKFVLIAKIKCWQLSKSLAAQANSVNRPSITGDIPLLRSQQQRLAAMEKLYSSLKGIPGFFALESSITTINESIEIAENLNSTMNSCASGLDELIDLKAAFKRLAVDGNELLYSEGEFAACHGRLATLLVKGTIEIDNFGVQIDSPDIKDLPFSQIVESCQSIIDNEPRLKAWCAWRRARKAAIDNNLSPVVLGLEAGVIDKESVTDIFYTAYCKWFASVAIDAEPLLRDFVAGEHMSSIEEFRKVDDQVAKLTAQYTRAVLFGQLPSKSSVGKKDGYGILKHELQKKRRHKPLRQLATEMGDAFSRLAPCMLMSPLSIAQYLPPDQQLFDLVIFDEASQITPWDAVGSIARGKQVVVAGDPKQMPPTNFFQRGASSEDLDGATDSDLESILDECLAVGIPRHSLSWHYRSRNESLIAFSNHRYYGGNLITFPAAVTQDTAVSWRRVNGTYAKGKSRTNQDEAKVIVSEVVKRLKGEIGAKEPKTLGIITLNTEQQRLIEDLLDKARRESPEIEPFFSEDLAEPVVVKNLETVQGDERDIIFIGISYGPTEPGSASMSMNFGPLNRDGGERRLNVAITRARQEMVIFTSFDASMIDLNRTSARAVRDLKHFLEFAERGPKALGEAVQGSVGGYDSAFEESVASRLREKGWQVVPQVGVSRFRIDLGIVHPDRPGDFLAGVECDGATYHSSATARDRDKVRASVLESLGWDLVRLWSTDWFTDPEGEIERLDLQLKKLHADKPGAKPAPIEPKEDVTEDEDETPVVSHVKEAPSTSARPLPSLEPIRVLVASKAAPANQSVGKGRYITTDFAEFEKDIDPENFYEESYIPVLKNLIQHTLETEAPIVDSLLINRIARAHGFKKSGRLIREAIWDLVEDDFHAREDPISGVFVWAHENQVDEINQYRVPSPKDVARSIPEIPYEEIRALLISNNGRLTPVEIARIFGIRRLAASARERVEQMIELVNKSLHN